MGVYASGGAPYHHLALAVLWGASARPVRAEDIAQGSLNKLDVLVFPGGGFSAMTGMFEPLGVNGAAKVRDWVEAGGMYVGSCAGSFLPAQLSDAYWDAHAEAKQLHMTTACLANGSDSIFEGLSSPGVGVLKAKVANSKHWLSKGLTETFEIVHYNGPLFDLSNATAAHPPFGTPEGVIQPIAKTAGFTPSEGFMNADVPSETLLDRCIQKQAYNGLVSPFGSGHVVLFGSHPEFGFDVLQLGWKEGVKLFANALNFQAQQRKSQAPSAKIAKQSSSQTLSDSAKQLERIGEQFTNLRNTNADAWLEGAVPSFLGRSAKQLWLEANEQAAQVALVTANLCSQLSSAKNLELVSTWIDDAPHPNQDVGFMGLKQLCLEIETQLSLALEQLKKPPVKLEHAYDGFTTHPYQIALSTYLSASGLTAAAHLSAVTIAKLSHNDELIPLAFLVL